MFMLHLEYKKIQGEVTSKSQLQYLIGGGERKVTGVC